MNNERQISVSDALNTVFPETSDPRISERIKDILDTISACGWTESPEGISFESLLLENQIENWITTFGIPLEVEANSPVLSEKLLSDLRRQRRAQRFYKKTEVASRGSVPKMLATEKTDGNIFIPRNSARNLTKEKNEKLLGSPNGLSAKVLRLIQNGPNFDLRIGYIPQELYDLYEEEIYNLDTRDQETAGITTIVRPMPLKDANSAADYRKAMIIELWGAQNPWPEFSVVVSTRPDKYDEATDDRILEGFSTEEGSQAPISKDESTGEYNMTLPNEDKLWQEHELVARNSTQTVTRISRFMLNYCLYGSEYLYQTDDGILDNLNIAQLLKKGDFWFSKNIFFHPAHYKDIQEDQELNYNYKKREAEIVSRFMVAYMLDPYRFLTAAYSLDFLEYLPIGNAIKECGGFDKWVAKIGAGLQGNTADKLEQLSRIYREDILPKLDTKDSPWFQHSYIGFPGFMTNFSEMVALLTPDFGKAKHPYSNYSVDELIE